MKKEKTRKIKNTQPDSRGLALTLRVPPTNLINIPAPLCKAEAVFKGQTLYIRVRKWVDKGLSAPAHATVRVRMNGNFLIPEHIREFLNIKPGDYLEVTILGRWGDRALIQETSQELVPFQAAIKDALVLGKDNVVFIEDNIGGREDELGGCHE